MTPEGLWLYTHIANGDFVFSDDGSMLYDRRTGEVIINADRDTNPEA